ncbi:MAG: DUF3014 domain-containing protein [Rudaea sp.]
MERVEPLPPDTDFDRPADPRRREARRRSVATLVAVAVAIAIVAAGFYAWRRLSAPTPPATPPVTTQSAPQPTQPAASAPKYPIEAADVTPAPLVAPLPLPEDSDAALQDALAGLFNVVPLDHVFYLQQIVPRFVATIDNLPRQTVALSKMPVKPVAGALATTQADGKILLRADNAERYEAYLRVMERADTQKLVSTYVHFYPLFQKAYEDLGYPDAYFNDRLVAVIDHLLAAPDVPAPIELAQPKILYEFADPSLEQLSAGQKMMIRLGPVDEGRVKAKLRAIRRALTGQALPRDAKK